MNLRKLASFAFGSIGVAAVSLITVPLMAWYFKAEDIGKISMMQIGVSFCLLLFSFGLDQAYVREYHDTNNKAGLFKACIIPGVVLLLIGLSGLLLLEPTALSRWLLGINESAYSVMLATCFIAAFVGRFLSLILRMQERGWSFSISQLMPKVLFLAVLGVFIIQNSRLELTQLLIAHTVAFISVVALFAWNTRDHWQPMSETISLRKQRELLSFGLPLVVSGAAFWGLTSLDRVFLKHYSGFEELGMYSVINSFAGVAIVLQNIFTTVWAPTAYKWHAEGIDSAKFEIMVDRVLGVVILIFSLAGMFSWILEYMLPVKYHNGQYIITTCLIYPLLYSLSETTGIGLGIKRKSGWSMLAMLLALCVNVLFSYWLVPIYGAAGAATGTGLSFLALLVLRTELSVIFYANIRRFNLYLYIILCVALSIVTALIGEINPLALGAAWFCVFLISLYHLKFYLFIQLKLSGARKFW
jgi:O-antigen/teichoic acid export membrane protein